jgi:probable F420-dependent oxidoreductase
MKFGLMFVNSGPFSNPDLLAHLATTAENCGFESLWTVEHVVIPKGYQSPYPYSEDGKIPGGEEVAIPDPLLPLGFIAAITKKIKLATGVMILPQRHPLYVAKELATLDVLSGGRTILGIGSGWLKEEFDALGLDFHVRGARTDEAIKSLRAAWGDNPSSFHGKHFNFGPLASFPKPAQSKGVAIHIGGHSTAAARRAGRLGDGFFPALNDTTKLKELFGLMRDEAGKAGRDANAIELSCIGRATVEAVKPLQDVGIARVILAPPGFDKEALSRGLEKLGSEVISRV